MHADDVQALMGAFLTEAQEFLQILETQLLALESATDEKTAGQAVKSLFRAAHSLKGSALMFGLQDLANAAHRLEDCFGILRDRAGSNLASLNPELMTALLQGVDYLKALADQLSNPNHPVDAEALQRLTQLQYQLEAEFSLPEPSLSPMSSGADQAIVQAIFEYELPTVLSQMATELEQVQPEQLSAAQGALFSLQQQLAGAASMLQLPGLNQVAIAWQQLLESPTLTVEQLQIEGIILVNALEAMRQQVLDGEEPTLNLPQLQPDPPLAESFQSDTDLFSNLLQEMMVAEEDISTPFLTTAPMASPSVASGFEAGGEQFINPIPLHASEDSHRPAMAKQRPTIRVDVQQLNELINLVGELVINRTNLELQSEQLRSETHSMSQQIKRLQFSGSALRQEYDRLTIPQQQNSRSGFDSLELDHYSEFHSTAQTVIETTQNIHQSAGKVDNVALQLENGIDHLQRVTQQLRNRVMQLRVVPFSRVVDHFPRALRDMSHTYNKEINLVLLGRETKIDESLLGALRDPLLHLVRNAFDHGIESPEERIAKGKTPHGQIEIVARHQGGQTVITLSDDGRGIDPNRIRQCLVDRGITSPEQASSLALSDLYDYLFIPGFSTNAEVTDLSGRGVGLDVVRSNLQQVRGTIKIDSRLGQGTTFTLKLPLMLSIIPALLVQVGDQRLAVPLDAVEEILEINPQQIQKMGGQQMLEWREGFLQVVPLSELLHENTLPQPTEIAPTDTQPLVVLAGSGGHVAVQVDRLWGQQEIVVKPLPTPLAKPSGVVGSTIVGAGNVLLILDVDDVFNYVSVGTHSAKSLTPELEVVAPQRPLPKMSGETPLIMVVDDAYTIRQLLSRTLSRAHYQVIEAKDGQDALDQLHRGMRCRLIITDLEMPRMDGFELMRSLHSNPEYASIPVAVLTSRTGAKHRTLADELGADDYFTKPYREEELLQSVAKLLQAPTHSHQH
jgi:two-component system, chemotaxis family, sensor histidine kinase and response regulator PixL